MRACALIPIFDHGATIEKVVSELPLDLPCLIVDDGSAEPTREALRRVTAARANAKVLRRDRNGGKGAALKTGYGAARARGFTHVVQLDADGQHWAADVPRFLAAMRAQPDALVLGVPEFDASAPLARIYARQLSRGLVWLACLSRVVPDPLCGFRGVPLAAALAVIASARTGDWMDFEPELAVRLVWHGTPIAALPTRVIYPPDGISHFSFARDYPRLASLYLRLLGGMVWRAPELLAQGGRRSRPHVSPGEPPASEDGMVGGEAEPSEGRSPSGSEKRARRPAKGRA
jgi:glycosyltransferase involved in cell wall biosynthesis